jgi:hypothetical protein
LQRASRICQRRKRIHELLGATGWRQLAHGCAMRMGSAKVAQPLMPGSSAASLYNLAGGGN